MYNFSGIITLILYSALPFIGWLLLKKAAKSLKALHMLTPAGVADELKRMSREMDKSWHGRKTKEMGGKASSKLKEKVVDPARRELSADGFKQRFGFELQGEGYARSQRHAWSEGGAMHAGEKAAEHYTRFAERSGRLQQSTGTPRMEASDYAKYAEEMSAKLGENYLVPDDHGAPIPVPHAGSVDTGPGLNTEDPTHWANYMDIDYDMAALNDQQKYQVLSAVGMTKGLRNADGTENSWHLDSLTDTQRSKLAEGSVSVAAMVPRITVSRAEIRDISRAFNIDLTPGDDD